MSKLLKMSQNDPVAGRWRDSSMNTERMLDGKGNATPVFQERLHEVLYATHLLHQLCCRRPEYLPDYGPGGYILLVEVTCGRITAATSGG